MEVKTKIDNMEAHQYQDIYKSDDVPFTDVSAGIVKHLIKYGIGLFVVLLALSFIIKIPREINLDFELKGGSNETIFQYPETIYIHTFYKQTNDAVNAGDTLAEIASHKIVGYIEEYETWNQQLNLYKTRKENANKQTLLLLEKQISGIIKEIEKTQFKKQLSESAMEKDLKNRTLQLDNTKSQHKRNESLHNSQVISDLEFESSLRQVQIAEQELISENENYLLLIANIDNDLLKLENRKNELSTELNKQKAIYDYDLASIKNEIELVRKKVELNYGPFLFSNNAIILLSPVDGTINLRTESEHEMQSGEILLRIQSDSMMYYAYAEAGAKDIGQIQQGTKAILKIKSFPHYYYGTLKAEVATISPSPMEDGLYPIKLTITDTGKLQSKITKGMSGTASFVIEEKPVINYVLRSFLKAVTIDDE